MREYSFDVTTFHLERDGDVEFALWRHPSARRRDEAGRGVRITQSMVDALRAFLQPGDAAIDIGAHSGDSTVPIALAVAPGPVFAFEPNRYAYKVLLANSALNRPRTNIFPLNFAATPTDGDFEFEYSDPGFCNGGLHEGIDRWRHAHFFKLAVKGRNVRELLARQFPNDLSRVRYVKIDTEGFDRVVARSMRDLLAANRPYIKTEMYKHTSEDERRGYFRDLRDLGYNLYKVESEEADYRSNRIDESDVMRWSHFDMFAEPG